jgi:hypothetical protein
VGHRVPGGVGDGGEQDGEGDRHWHTRHHQA